MLREINSSGEDVAIVLVISTEILLHQLMLLHLFSGNNDKKRINKIVIQLQMIQFLGGVSFMIVQTRIVPLHTHQGNQNTDNDYFFRF